MPCTSFFYEKVLKWWFIKEDGQMTNAGILFCRSVDYTPLHDFLYKVEWLRKSQFCAGCT